MHSPRHQEGPHFTAPPNHAMGNEQLTVRHSLSLNVLILGRRRMPINHTNKPVQTNLERVLGWRLSVKASLYWFFFDIFLLLGFSNQNALCQFAYWLCDEKRNTATWNRSRTKHHALLNQEEGSPGELGVSIGSNDQMKKLSAHNSSLTPQEPARWWVTGQIGCAPAFPSKFSQPIA